MSMTQADDAQPLPFFVPLLIAGFLSPALGFALLLNTSTQLRCPRLWRHVTYSVLALCLMAALHVVFVQGYGETASALLGWPVHLPKALIALGVISLGVLIMLAIVSEQFEGYAFHMSRGLAPRVSFWRLIFLGAGAFVLGLILRAKTEGPLGAALAFLF